MPCPKIRGKFVWLDTGAFVISNRTIPPPKPRSVFILLDQFSVEDIHNLIKDFSISDYLKKTAKNREQNYEQAICFSFNFRLN